MEHPIHDSNSWFEPFHTSHVTLFKIFFYIIDYVYVFSIYSEKIYLQEAHWYGKFCHSKIFVMPRKPQNKRADVYFSASGRSSPLYHNYFAWRVKTKIACEEACHGLIFNTLTMHRQRDGQALWAVSFLSSLIPCHVRALKIVSDQI